MQISNVKPQDLSPVYTDRVGGAFDPGSFISHTVSSKLFTPLVASAPASITADGNPVSEQDVTDLIFRCCGDTVDTPAEDFLKEIFAQTLVSFDRQTPLLIKNLFQVQSAVRCHLPYPSAGVYYTAGTDVIPVCRNFLAGTDGPDMLFATMAFFAKPETLGFYFVNEAAFDAFKVWFNTTIQPFTASLPGAVTQLISQFLNIKLSGLTESFVLRNTDTDGCDPFSFPRILINCLMQYTSVRPDSEFGILPFDLGELYCPRTIILMNVEKHAQGKEKEIMDEWDILKRSLNTRPNIISNNKLMSLTAVTRSTQAITAAVSAKGGGQARAKVKKFKNTAPSSVDLAKLINLISKKMASVTRSENSYKQIKTSYQKPSRRDPDNYNLKGKIISTKFRPDIHIYLDTSGSISEPNYQAAVKALIKMARSMNVNLYFNSFSDCMTQCTHLRTKDRTTAQIWAEFQKIPKVTGGTDFEQIWHYINRSPKRKKELSLIVTDFAWSVPSYYVEHPRNLYYAPCAKMDYDRIKYYAEHFVKGMQHNDPDIRTHILM